MFSSSNGGHQHRDENMTRFYTLTYEEAAIYDSGDESAMHALASDIAATFRGSDAEIYHPDGFLWLVFTSDAGFFAEEE